MANDITHDRIMELAMGFCASKTLLSAVEIGVFGAFGEGPLDLPALRSRLQPLRAGPRAISSMPWSHSACVPDVMTVDATAIKVRKQTAFSTLPDRHTSAELSK